ncbi:serine/threonine protein kinase [Nocardia amikacinitolerans]|nr:serine/threonine-protein kinase [Nocardia amikacinitolerans]MCP2295551.1 serine/threonine protein kinase [Nocardia amikacinitolerans]
MTDLRAGEVFAGYEIERVLGKGGMGTVYLAKHPRLPRKTALKLLNAEMFGDNEIRARFEREADLIARLEHPNIVAVYDRGVEDRSLWISMQYIAGTDVATLGAIEPALAVRVITEAAAALDYAHRQGVLHRDIKPANILLGDAEPGQPPRVFLADFGIARLRDEQHGLTQTGTFTATLAFASPEQLTGAPLDHRCDQYSLACTLFALLTGTVPYDSTNPVSVIRSHLSDPPPPISARRHGLPPALDTVLARALAKRPEARYASCGEFAAAVAHALQAGRPATGPQQVGAPVGGGWQPPNQAPLQPIPHGFVAGNGGMAPVNPSYPAPPFRPASPHIPAPYGPNGGSRPAGVGRPSGKLIAALGVGLTVLLVGVVGVVSFAAKASDSSPRSWAGLTTVAWPEKEGKIVADFPKLLPGGKGTTATGWRGVWCTFSDGLDHRGFRCLGGDADAANFTLYDYKSAAAVREKLDSFAAEGEGPAAAQWSRKPHAGCASDPLIFLPPPGAMSPITEGDVFTTFPDDPRLSRYLIGIDRQGYNEQQLIDHWWADAPICG